jgi:hypothetical protein
MKQAHTDLSRRWLSKALSYKVERTALLCSGSRMTNAFSVTTPASPLTEHSHADVYYGYKSSVLQHCMYAGAQHVASLPNTSPTQPVFQLDAVVYAITAFREGKALRYCERII